MAKNTSNKLGRFGYYLRELRKKMGLTQKEMNTLLGYDGDGTYGKIEMGWRELGVSITLPPMIKLFQDTGNLDMIREVLVYIGFDFDKLVESLAGWHYLPELPSIGEAVEVGFDSPKPAPLDRVNLIWDGEEWISLDFQGQPLRAKDPYIASRIYCWRYIDKLPTKIKKGEIQ